MGAKNKVIAGDYQGMTVMPLLNCVCIQKSSFSKDGRVELNSSTVEAYELITEDIRKSAASGVMRGAVGGVLLGPVGMLAGGLSAKNKGVYNVAVKFKDGKNSLLEIDDKMYKTLVMGCFGVGRGSGGMASTAHAPATPSRLCSYCGNPIKADAKFCDNCGAKVEEQENQNTVAQELPHTQAQGQNQAVQTPPAARPPKKKGIGCLIVVLVVLGILIAIIVSTGPSDYDVESGTAEEGVTQLFDVTSYALITPEELVARAGEPASIDENYNFMATTEKYVEGVLYSYPGLGTEFLFENGQCVQVTTYGEAWQIGGSEDNVITVSSNDEIFAIFGLDPDDSAWTKKDDTGVAIHYYGNGTVKEFWVSVIENNTFFTAKSRFVDWL